MATTATTPHQAQQDEWEWVRQFQRGEVRGFEALRAAHAERIYRLCLRLTGGNAADAQDLAQDVFVAAFRGPARLRGARLGRHLAAAHRAVPLAAAQNRARPGPHHNNAA
jgi:hypothetical protein